MPYSSLALEDRVAVVLGSTSGLGRAEELRIDSGFLASAVNP